LKINLTDYKSSYTHDRGLVIRITWYIINALILRNPFVIFSNVKRAILRFFGAKVGLGVVIKPNVNLKYPWNLEIGDNSWIGEGVWIDNLAPVRIGSDVCLSQGVFLCTGNHDWSDASFALMTKPIAINDGAWVCAKAIILPGVTLSAGSVVGAGAVVSTDTEPNTIYRGNPAEAYKKREMRRS